MNFALWLYVRSAKEKRQTAKSKDGSGDYLKIKTCHKSLLFLKFGANIYRI